MLSSRFIFLSALLISTLQTAFAQNAVNAPLNEEIPVNGTRFTLLRDVPGRNAVAGDVVQLHILGKAGELVLGDSRSNGAPVNMLLEPPAGADIHSVLPYMSEGDSAVVHIACDSILARLKPEMKDKLPEWMKSGNEVVIYLSVLKIGTKEEFEKEAAVKRAHDKEYMMHVDDSTLHQYFAKKKIRPIRKDPGFYMTIQRPGSGQSIRTGTTVKLKYTGRLIDGTPFDSNTDTTIGHHGKDLLVFEAGMGQMIPGMDMAMRYLKKGSKAKLYIPSPLAYGDQKVSEAVPANSIMIFDVEVVGVTETKQ